MSFVDSIAVKLLNKDLVLYGRGNRLVLKAGKCQYENKLRPYDKIHRISTRIINEESIQFACAAGREVLFGEIVNNEFSDNFISKFNDWISSVKILNDGRVAVLTAHGFLGLVEIVNCEATILQKIQCGENSTLYCSLIYGTLWENLIIFGGTALGELVVWQASDGRFLNRQFLHNGVIFSIDFDGVNLLTSSDDRSIKFFTIEHLCDFQLREEKQLFGHTSRVFACKIVIFRKLLVFLSAGEDSNLCIWNAQQGDLIAKKNVHSSGFLWCVDYDSESEVAVSSSSTGRLNKFDLKDIASEFHHIEQISTMLGRNFPSKVKFLTNETIVLLDNLMNIHYKTNLGVWECIESENHRKIVAMEVYEQKAFFISIDTLTVFQYSSETCMKLKLINSLEISKMLNGNLKLDYLRSIHVLSDDEICVCDASGLFIVVSLMKEGGKILKTFQIPKCFEPWSKSVANIKNIWIVGDRIGNLHLFDFSKETSSPIFKLSKLHGNIGVTSIKVLNKDFIQTTGIDGNIRTINIKQADNGFDHATLEIQQTERTSVNGIDKICNWNNKDFVLGFNDDFFVVYDQCTRQILYERKCGGRHRCWDISSPDENGKVRFAYINKKKLNLVEFPLNNMSFDGENGEATWHVLDCNVIERIDNILVTGGEDTQMKVLKIKSGSEKVEEVATVYSHISNIKAVKLIRCDDDILIFSAGGRAQISINRLTDKKNMKEEVNFLLSKCDERIDNKSFDPETRFTSIFYDETLQNLLVACSDGFIRIFKYNTNLNLILEHFYGRCILKIHVFDHLILSMATDGFICFWKHKTSTNELILLSKLKHNQSGINCFDIVKINNEEFLIATGGDDNAIFITKVIMKNQTIELGETISNNKVHIAQITGLKFTKENELSTTSIDQTLCKLRIVNSVIELIERRFTCVSDVKGLIELEDKRFVVYGAGMEIL